MSVYGQGFWGYLLFVSEIVIEPGSVRGRIPGWIVCCRRLLDRVCLVSQIAGIEHDVVGWLELKVEH